MDSERQQSLYDEVARLLASASGFGDAHEQRSYLAEARVRATALVQADPTNADYHHALALTWYKEPQESVVRVEHVAKHLRKALALDPAHAFARVYMGYFLFDEGSFGEALAHFWQVDQAFFQGIDQVWRNLKTRELMLVCRLRLHPEEVALAELEQLVAQFRQTDEMDAPNPDELVQTAGKLVGQGHWLQDGAEARVVAGLIHALGYENGYKEELKILLKH